MDSNKFDNLNQTDSNKWITKNLEVKSKWSPVTWGPRLACFLSDSYKEKYLKSIIETFHEFLQDGVPKDSAKAQKVLMNISNQFNIVDSNLLKTGSVQQKIEAVKTTILSLNQPKITSLPLTIQKMIGSREPIDQNELNRFDNQPNFLFKYIPTIVTKYFDKKTTEQERKNIVVILEKFNTLQIPLQKKERLEFHAGYQLGRIYLKQGEMQKAIDTWSSSVKEPFPIYACFEDISDAVSDPTFLIFLMKDDAGKQEEFKFSKDKLFTFLRSLDNSESTYNSPYTQAMVEKIKEKFPE